MTRSRARRGSERGVAAAVAGLAIVAAGGAAATIVRQRSVLESQRQVEAQTLALARADRSIADAGDPMPAEAPPRTLVNLALLDARAVSVARTATERGRLLARAKRSVDAALASRPRWGEAELVAAFVAAGGGRRQDRLGLLHHLSTSYRDAPLLRDGGAWRVATGLALYPALAGTTRRQVIEEAVWLARIDNPNRTEIFARARASAAYRDLLARWHAVRALDADGIGRQRPAP